MKKLLFLLLVIGCGSEDPTPTKYEIAPQLQTQVDAFYSEAQERGYNFEKDNLIVKPIASGSTVSKCYMKKGQRYIEILVIDPSNCQELPVFREMARALMNIQYVSSGDAIMNPDTNPCIYVHVPTGEFTIEREEFINQLFQ